MGLHPKQRPLPAVDYKVCGLGGIVHLRKLARGYCLIKAPEEITLFKSLGLAIEDVASAHHIFRKAVEQDQGTWVELGGSRHGIF